MKKHTLILITCSFLLLSLSCQKTQNSAQKQSNQEAPSGEKTLVKSAEVPSENAPKTTFAEKIARFFSPKPENNKAEENLVTATITENETSETPLQVPISDIFQSEKGEMQTFSFPANTTQTLKLPQGTKIIIPENAFVLEGTNKPATGEVKVEAKEVMNVADCLRMGVTTMSDKGLLESGGMLYIEATCQGQKCALKKGKSLKINMPSWGERAGDMGLFTGKKNADGKVEWEKMAGKIGDREAQPNNAADNWSCFGSDNDYLNVERTNPWANALATCGKNEIDSLDIFILKEEAKKFAVYNYQSTSFRVLPNEGLTDADVADKNPIGFKPFTGINAPYLERKNASFEVKKEKYRLFVEVLKIADNGNILSWEIAKKSQMDIFPIQDKSFQTQLSNKLKSRKWLKTGVLELEVYLPENTVKELHKEQKNLVSVQTYRTFYKNSYKNYCDNKREYNKTMKLYSCEDCKTNFLEWEAKNKQREERIFSKEEKDAKAKTQDATTYVFKSSRLGWINCDRFVDEPKTQMAMELGEYQEAQVSVIYRKIRSLMSYNVSPEKNVIAGVPQNHAITLFIVKRVEDKLYYCLKQSNTNSKVQQSFDFQELTKEKLKEITKKFEAV
jgi:hypothetical protein